jgi:hypothetical protein
MVKRVTEIKATLLLFLLSPLIAELLSSSAPPVEFFGIGGLLILGLYGPGVVIVREVARRWRKGCLSLLLLGMSYGIIEEGVAVKSFFDPGWQDLGIYSWYGRWLGVNWPWAFELTIYHAIISIVVPIILVEALFPRIKEDPWLSRRGLAFLLGIFILDIALLNVFLTRYQPSLFHYLITFLVIALLWFMASRLHKIKGMSAVPRPRKLWLMGFIWGLSFLFFFGVLPYVQPYPEMVMVVGALYVILPAMYLVKRNWEEASPKSLYALAAGPVSSLILLTPIHELSAASRPDNPRGMLIVGIIALILLLVGWRRVSRVQQSTI